MAFGLTVHHFRRDNRTGHRVLTKVTPYIAIATREGRLYVQNGKVWSEGGEEVPTPPAWFWDEWRKIRPERRAQFGLPLPEERKGKATSDKAA